MAEADLWDPSIFSPDTAEFDRALHRLRDGGPTVPDPARVADLVARLRAQPGITQREFDRRFRLILAGLTGGNEPALRQIADYLRRSSPAALNALRTLLPPELRHLAAPTRANHRAPAAVMAPTLPAISPNPTSTSGSAEPSEPSKYRAVALIGTPEEHVRNEALLRSEGLDPMRLPDLDQLWNVATTGLCGFVVGGSVWARVPARDQRRTVRRICEYSTFMFARVCLDGLHASAAERFGQDAVEVRGGPIDGNRFCHGDTCNLTPADVAVLRSVATLLEVAGTADFFPLGLSETDASLLRLIAVDRHHPDQALTIRRLGTRELLGGRSGARVFLLNDGGAQPFVAKVAEPEQLTVEFQRYRTWIQGWEPSVTNPTFHSHLGRTAISYRLQSAADAHGTPAPPLEEKLEQLRASEWTDPVEQSRAVANDLYLALSRAVDRLVVLNSRSGNGSPADEFWLDWPVRDLAARGIEVSIVDKDWRPLTLSELVEAAMSRLRPNLGRGVVHGDVHGRNILLLDRLPAFIDFAWSGPGHPLVDLVRLDAVVRSIAMRMVVEKRSLFDLYRMVYVDGSSAEDVLARSPQIAASPLAGLSVKVSAKVREAALAVAKTHSLDLRDFLAMTCVVAGHVLVNRNPGSGIERLVLSVVGSEFLNDDEP